MCFDLLDNILIYAPGALQIHESLAKISGNSPRTNPSVNSKKSFMPELSRRTKIKPEVQRNLWGRAASRCQFNGCNKLLDRSAVTQEAVNIAQMAHIYSFSEEGPRGWNPLWRILGDRDGIENLLLVCHGCHRAIDQSLKAGKKYPGPLLRGWKEQHERRVRIVTGISPSKSSHVVIFDSRIGDERPRINFDECVEAIFPFRYPADDHPVELSMTSKVDDSTEGFWLAQRQNLRLTFEEEIRRRIERNGTHHFSVFALASQPLLILLGSLFTDKIDTTVYQPHREPRSWNWQPHPEEFSFQVVPPADFSNRPALVISLSDKINHDRVKDTLPGRLSIWELTIASPHNDFLRSEAQLSEFRESVRKLIVAITTAHPDAKELSIFPAMPVSCAVEFGRTRMPKTNLVWHIYDQNNKHQKFIPTIRIGDPNA